MERKLCAAPWRGLHINFRGEQANKEFAQHIDQIENFDHPDQRKNFKKLWPELDFLTKWP